MAKNYRELKRLYPNDWEKDNEWMGKRLAFIWYVKDYRSDLYHSLNLIDEKEDFYKLNSKEVKSVALKDYESVDRDKYDNIYGNANNEELLREYNYLKTMKDENFEEFLLKKNCNTYEYFNMLIKDGLLRIETEVEGTEEE